MQIAPTFFKEYNNREDKNATYTYSIKAYLPYEGQETMVLNHVASTKRKVYVNYPECYIEITSPSGAITAHHLENEEKLKRCLLNWSSSWGEDFWRELISRYLV